MPATPTNNATPVPAVDISADTQASIAIALQSLETELIPDLLALRPDDRRGLAKLGEKTVSFVDKSVDYADSHPQFRPAFVIPEVFRKNLEMFNLLQNYQRVIKKLHDLLDDSITKCGSDALNAALAFYQSTQTAAKLNLPGAQTIVDDLSVRFAARSPKAPAPAPAPSGDSNGESKDD